MKLPLSDRTSSVWKSNRDYWVYTHLASDGTVLYVGCTSYRRDRERQHQKSSAWFPAIAETRYEGPFDRETGLDRESALIRQLDPPNNYMHTSRYRWRLSRAEAEAAS